MGVISFILKKKKKKKKNWGEIRRYKYLNFDTVMTKLYTVLPITMRGRKLC
jgi:hypothetical protein